MSTADGGAPPRRSGLQLALALLSGTVLGLMLFLYRHLETVASGGREPFVRPLIREMLSGWIASVLFFAVRRVARRYPLEGPGWPRRLPAHVVAVVLFGVTFTSLNWAARRLLYAALGQGHYDYGAMPVRYLMEFPLQVIVYFLFVAGVQVADHRRVARERELRAAQTEAQLARTQLDNLQLRLQPHFLFNALNTISATMYDDPAAADEMIGHLAELLRASLRTRPAHEVPLREELAVLSAYLGLMKARFGPQVEVEVAADPAALDLAVPALLVQPLVENAFRHGSAAATGHGRIAVRARRDGDALRVAVTNDVAGLPAGPPGSGLGLSLTAERLRLLYGRDHEFEAGPDGPASYAVRLRLPARPVGAA